MGIHERMPPGLINHGGPGSGHPYLLILFHDPAYVFDEKSGAASPAAGKLIVWGIDQVHHYGNATRPWDHSWLHVSGTWADRVLPRGGAIELGSLLPISRPEGILTYLNLLYDELQGQIEQDAEMIEGIIGLMWQHLSREARGGERPSQPIDPRLHAARQLLDSTFTGVFDLSAASEVACLSPSYFCHRFSQQFGVPPGEYVTRLRLNRAAQLLTNPDIAVWKVAQAVGYDDALYFSRLFRNRFGVNPMQYRKRR